MSHFLLEVVVFAVSPARSAACTSRTFAAVMASGAVITWDGDKEGSADSRGVAGLQDGVQRVVGNANAFVALKEGGEVVVWGDAEAGGCPPASVLEQLHGVVQIACTHAAFAAVKENGEVVTWGDAEFGGDSSSVSEFLKEDVTSVVGTFGCGCGAFAALKAGGAVVAWGDPELTEMSATAKEQLESGVKSLCAGGSAFAALKDNGQVVSFGRPEQGGELKVHFTDDEAGQAHYSVEEELSAGVVSIVGSDDVFAALKEGGKVVTWGVAEDGAHLQEDIAKELQGDVLSISHATAAFAAIKRGGRVVTFGVDDLGGDPGPVAEKLERGVVKIPSFKWQSMYQCVALKEDGSVVQWGWDKGPLVDIPHDDLTSGVVELLGNPQGFVALKHAPVSGRKAA